MFLIDPDKLVRSYFDGQGSIDVELSTGQPFILTMLAVHWLAGSTSAALSIILAPEDPGQSDFTLHTIASVGNGADAFYGVDETELHHFYFPHRGQPYYGDKLKLSWSGAAADEWRMVVDVANLR